MAGFLRLGARRVLIAMSKLVKNGHLSSEVRITPAFLQPDTRFFGRDEEPEATKRGQKIALPPIAPTDTAKRSRRRFTQEDKSRILRLADACTDESQLGALLRREGIYKHTLQRFITQRDSATLDTDVTRSQKSKAELEADELRRVVSLLERQNSSLTNKLRKAEIAIDFQKKLSQLFALEMEDTASPDCERR
jgi:transposase-like protein